MRDILDILDEYVSIISQADLEEMLDKARGFHDSIIKEVVMLNKGYVEPDSRCMYQGEFLFNARILIQTQWEDIPAVELLAEDITLLAIKNIETEVSGTVEPKGITLYFGSSQSLDNAVVAKRIRYRLLGNGFLGKGPFFSQWPFDIEEYGDIGIGTAGFTKLVMKNFSFLVDEYGMNCSNVRDGTWLYSSVTYCSNTVELKISHERYSIDLTIKYLEPEFAEYGRLRLFDFLPILKENDDRCGFQAASEDKIDQSLHRMADILREYSGTIFVPNHEFLSLVKEDILRQAEKYTTDAMMRQALAQSERAWRGADYAKFIAILEPVKHHLSGSNLKKFEYAEKKLKHF